MARPIYIPHYRGNGERRAYLEAAFAGSPLRPRFITAFDREDLPPHAYAYDEADYRRMLAPIKDVLIGYAVGLFEAPLTPWAECVRQSRAAQRTLDEEFARLPWLRPRALAAAEVSLALKHREAWRKVAEGVSDWAIIAEDDILLSADSLRHLAAVTKRLPADFDYVDIAGGCNLVPRAGDQQVNEYFFRIDPPRDRTTCCAIMRKAFARRLVRLGLPIVLPVDWTLTHAMGLLDAKVYWVKPLVFGHGSEMRVYASSLR
ncbi:MAG TPA: hypothetical protein VFA22_06635 [Stellaceae bacterium]|nr:hypothetical protein [Stellaceae bacterium]